MLIRNLRQFKHPYKAPRLVRGLSAAVVSYPTARSGDPSAKLIVQTPHWPANLSRIIINTPINRAPCELRERHWGRSFSPGKIEYVCCVRRDDAEVVPKLGLTDKRASGKEA